MANIEDDITRTLRFLVIITAILFVALSVMGVIGFVYAVNQNAKYKDLTLSTTSALCTLRFDLEQRVEASKAFLKDNPNGISGISPEVIQAQIDSQQRTITALSILPCTLTK